MWSTSPADRIFRVPPFVAHFVGTGGGVVETASAVDDVCPLALLDLPLLPQPAASRASPATVTTVKPSLSRPRVVLRMFMAPPFRASVVPLLIRHAGVERVANAVSEEVEREHGEDEGGTREREVPPGGVEDRGRLGDHLAPARLGWVDSDAEVRERCLEQDVLRDDQRREDDDRRDEVREDLPEQDRRITRARSPGGLDELLLAQRRHLSADDAADVRPVDDDDRHDHRREPRLDQPAEAAATD